MAAEWQELTALTRGAPFVVERVRLVDKGVAIEGRFEVPPLARLSAEDQVFVIVFVRSHGSIKKMQELFGVSYPTIKNRLNRLAAQFEFVDVTAGRTPDDVLSRLERGEISVEEALKELGR